MQPENEMQEKEKTLDTPEMEVKVAEEVLDESAKIAEGKDSDMKGPGDEKNKMSKKQIIGLVVLSLIAIGGVLFGIYGMNSQNEQIAELKGRVSSADEKVAQLETEVAKNDDVAIDDEVEIVDDANVVAADAVDTADYIYVGEWGLKIKIPEELSEVGYDFSVSTYGEHLSVAGVKSEEIQNSFQYTNADKFFAGAIMRSNSEDGFYPYGSLVYTDDEQNKYYYEGPQADMGLTEEETNIWKESVEIIKKMLTNPDNYSKI